MMDAKQLLDAMRIFIDQGKADEDSAIFVCNKPLYEEGVTLFKIKGVSVLSIAGVVDEPHKAPSNGEPIGIQSNEPFFILEIDNTFKPIKLVKS